MNKIETIAGNKVTETGDEGMSLALLINSGSIFATVTSKGKWVVF